MTAAKPLSKCVAKLFVKPDLFEEGKWKWRISWDLGNGTRATFNFPYKNNLFNSKKEAIADCEAFMARNVWGNYSWAK